MSARARMYICMNARAHARTHVYNTARGSGRKGRTRRCGQPIKRLEQLLLSLLIFTAHTHALAGVKEGHANLMKCPVPADGL